MANNNLLYNAALAGAIGAQVDERWITDLTSADYVSERNAAIAFATAVDAAIPATAGITDGNARVMESIVKSVLSQKAFTAGLVVNAMALAVVALYNAMAPALAPEAPLESQTIGYTAAAPLALTLVAAGHTPGLYQINYDLIVRTVAGAGSVSRSVAYSAPTFGATTNPAAFIVLTTLGHAIVGGASNVVGYVPAVVRSDGTAPIVLTFTPSGVAGSPVIDVYASAELISRAA